MDGDTGLSSKALCSFFLTAGHDGECASKLPAPCDPADFNRCMVFLQNCINPWNREELISSIGEVTKGWKIIKKNWIDLVILWRKEKDQESAPELYTLMKKIGL